MIALLTIIFYGNEYAGMYIFGKTHETILKRFMELPNGIPSQDTFERVFSRLNQKIFASKFNEWVKAIKESVEEKKTGINVSINRKTIRRSKRKDKKAIHAVNAFESELSLVLGEIATNKKSNEITAIPELLDMFCNKGMVITIDAKMSY